MYLAPLAPLALVILFTAVPFARGYTLSRSYTGSGALVS